MSGASLHHSAAFQLYRRFRFWPSVRVRVRYMLSSRRLYAPHAGEEALPQTTRPSVAQGASPPPPYPLWPGTCGTFSVDCPMTDRWTDRHGGPPAVHPSHSHSGVAALAPGRLRVYFGRPPTHPRLPPPLLFLLHESLVRRSLLYHGLRQLCRRSYQTSIIHHLLCSVASFNSPLFITVMHAP